MGPSRVTERLTGLAGAPHLRGVTQRVRGSLGNSNPGRNLVLIGAVLVIP